VGTAATTAGYVRLLALAMRRRAVVGLVIAGVLASTVPLALVTPATFLPREDESRFEVALRLPEGTSLEETALFAGRLARAIRALPGVAVTVVQAGSSPDDSAARGPNEATVYVGLAPVSERESSQDDLMARVRSEVAPSFATTTRGMPVPLLLVGAVDAFGSSGTDAAPIQWTMRGRDLDELGVSAERLLAEARRIPGTLDHALTLRTGAPEAALTLDRERGAARGVTAAQLASTLALLSGDTVLATTPDERGLGSLEVRMVAPAATRDDPRAILDVHVASASGELVRLGDVASLAPRPTPSAISRTDRMRQVTLTMSVAPGFGDQAVLDAIREAEERLGLPAEHRGQPAGNARELERTARGFLLAIVLSLVFMYLILAAQFESFVDPAVILASLPLTVPFALISLLGTGLTLNIFSALGVLVLFGVVKKNAILQVDHVRQLRAAGMPRALAVLRGNRDRLRPIVMTTLAFVVGAVPLLLSTGSGAGTNQSIGAVIVGGQSLSLLLTLVATPVLATAIEDARLAIAAWWSRVLSTRRAVRA
jgi:HAE1 family hydrophobic/amphiphilic exporter-1